LQDREEVAKAIGEWLKVAPANWPHFARLAGVLAQGVTQVQSDENLTDSQRKSLTAAYGDQAMSMLHRAVAAGYKDVDQLKNDVSFRPLRERSDFQELVAKLQK